MMGVIEDPPLFTVNAICKLKSHNPKNLHIWQRATGLCTICRSLFVFPEEVEESRSETLSAL